ncbi:S-adenosyl-L-methionine-dependent methyltransferase [Thozetella sp. PMI_491]|nr:S-adenosyl-L-methionine-dependent methyltransferase [Thozetella sp. PMI_491]
MAHTETQIEIAIRVYDARADTYELSWHPKYSRRFVPLIPIKPGHRVLSLCCGTGLDAFLAADAVGESGRVVGVDISSGMLAKAAERKGKDGRLGPRITLLHHSVTDLGTLDSLEVRKESFDIIMCSNSFVLFDHPSEVVRMWKDYLRPGGYVAIDIPHEHNFTSAVILERVASLLGAKFPSTRAWIKSKDTFSKMLEDEGFVVEDAQEIENISGEPATHFTLEKADEQFEYVTKSPFVARVFGDDHLVHAKEMFRDEFTKEAVEGKVPMVDSLYFYLARKP